MKRLIGIFIALVIITSSFGLTEGTSHAPPSPLPSNAFTPVIVLPSALPVAPHFTPEPTAKPTAKPTPKPTPKPKPKPKVVIVKGWNTDREISWYGPGFYGKRTACGKALTKTLIGVAHRSLPCGTIVFFRYKGITIKAPVVDRGPYVAGRIFDLTGGACVALHHCFTGPIEYKVVR